MADSERATFLIAFLSNFLSAMHRFRDNEVLLQAGYDVIEICPPGGASVDFFMTDYNSVTMTFW